MLLRRIGAVLALGLAAATAIPSAASAAPAPKNPVVVVGGLSGFAAVYEPLASRLRNDGYRVFVYELPGLGFGDIAGSARAFRDYIAQLKSSNGFSKVDLVGHSEGGLVSRYYLKFLGGTSSVGRYVSLGTPQYGTYVANIIAFLGVGSCLGIPACQQMSIGSTFLAELNAGDDTPGSVRYTAVRTLQDELVRPVGNASINDGATNVLVQSACPLRLVGHLGLALDGTVYSIIQDALADSSITPNCFAL
jgi:triacylglycerol esterase/lipase EstA (alpha/beta hydrolase family)